MSARLAPAALVLAALVAASPALAAGPVQAVPTPPLVGDGATPATLQVLAPNGTRVKVSADQGEVLAVESVDGGHRITWRPPPVGERTTVGLDVKVRGGGVKEDLRLEAVLVPSWTGGFSITLDPSSVGSGESATVNVRPSSPGPLGGERELRIVASDGSIGDLVPTGDGAWKARYTAPRTDSPARPVLAVADAAAPITFVDAEVVPVVVTEALTLDAPADTMNVLRVGSREYGPNKASPAGKVAFEVEVHPDITEGTLTTSRGSEVTTQTITLPVEVAPSLVVAPLPAKAGGGTTLPVPLACKTGPGASCDPRDLEIEVSGGSVGDPVPRGELLILPWTLPDSGRPSLTASLGEVSATASVSVVPSPNTLTLSSDPPALSDEDTTAEITARAKDPAGKGVIGRTPGFEVRNGRLYRRPRDNRDGTYTGTWRLDGDADWLEAIAWPQLSGTGLEAQRLVAFPVVQAVQADGATEISLVVVAEDAVGMPVPYTDLELAVPQGDGAVKPTARTDANGIAIVTYKVGVEPGLAEIDITGAGLETTAVLWQSGPDAPPPDLAALGSTPDVQAVARWKERVASLYISKRAAPVVAQAPAPTPGTAPAVPGATPVAPTEPAPTAPATAPGGSTAKAPKPGKSSGGASPTGYSRARARLALANAPFSYASTLDGDGADRFAPEASIALGTTLASNVALQADGEVWLGSTKAIGLDLRARGGLYRLALGPDKKVHLPWAVEAGLRYRAWDNGTWSAYAGGGFARTSEIVFAYTDPSRTSAQIVDSGILGLRAGGGLRGEWGPGLFELDGQTIWGPGPNYGRLEARGEFVVSDPLLLTLAFGADGRLSSYRPDDEVRVRIRRGGLDIRVGIAVATF